MKYFVFVLSVVLLLFVWTPVIFAQGPLPFEYISPVPGAELVSAATTIAVRHGEDIDETSLSTVLFDVTGTQSGLHTGRIILAEDNKTVILEPDQPFAPGERVRVAVSSGLTTVSGEVVSGTTFEFVISLKEPGKLDEIDTLEAVLDETQVRTDLAQLEITGSSIADYVTAPDTLPEITITTAANDTGEGYNFLSNFDFTNPISSNSYLLILDNLGDLVFYQKLPWIPFDFKVQPNGLVTYFYGPTNSFQVMDPSYTIIDSYAAGNGYTADSHDLQILPDNGHALLLIYDPQPVDMSQIVAGGVPTATVVGLVVQELDTAKNVVFEWRSWDHMNITDTVVSLTTPVVDYVHGNAVERDFDGNLLISSRHLDEITKINRQTGEIIWRWGGKRNEFVFVNNDPFYHQHDIRRLANDHVTLFDNGNGRIPEEYSRAVEFQLDEVNKIAESVWEYRNTPDAFGAFMGNAQRLPNGNTMIGWGGAFPSMTEVKPDGTEAFELTMPFPNLSYRAFRFPWQGFPFWPPALVIQSDAVTTTLYYSWNGATNVVYYRIYGGKTPEADTLIASQVKGGFENSYDVTDLLDEMCYFRVMPVDNQGQPTQYSNVVFAELSVCGQLYMPLIIKD